MKIPCPKGHLVPESYQIILCACPECAPDEVRYTYHSPITGEHIDWPPELRDAEIEKARQEGIKEGTQLTINKFRNLTGMTEAELEAFHE